MSQLGVMVEPPVSSWTQHPNHVDHIALAKPFVRNRLVPLPDLESDSTSPSGARSGIRLDSATERKLFALERSMDFLIKEHTGTLAALQAEIERLKNDNSALQFQLVMVQSGSDEIRVPDKQGTDKRSQFSKETAPRNTELEGQVKELRTALQAEKERSQNLQRTLDHKNISQEVPDLPIPMDPSLPLPSVIDLGGFTLTLDPLWLRLGDGGAAAAVNGGSLGRQPSLLECETAIKLVLQSNMRLSNELQCLQNDTTRLSSRSLGTREASQVSVGGAAACGPLRGGGGVAPLLPPIVHGQSLQLPAPSLSPRGTGGSEWSRPTSTSVHQQSSTGSARKLPAVPAPPFLPKNSTSLPALRQTLGTKAAERRRRTQAIQKRRLENSES